MRTIGHLMKTLNPAVARVLKRLHYPLDVILTCVRWYVAYPLSLRHWIKADRASPGSGETALDRSTGSISGRRSATDVFPSLPRGLRTLRDTVSTLAKNRPGARDF